MILTFLHFLELLRNLFTGRKTTTMLVEEGSRKSRSLSRCVANLSSCLTMDIEGDDINQKSKRTKMRCAQPSTVSTTWGKKVFPVVSSWRVPRALTLSRTPQSLRSAPYNRRCKHRRLPSVAQVFSCLERESMRVCSVVDCGVRPAELALRTDLTQKRDSIHSTKVD